MKKGLILLGLLLATLSCNHAETELAESRITVFHAVNGDDEDTKTVLKEGGQIWWMPEDAIKLFWSETEQGRAGIELVSNNTEPSSSTVFICPASFDGNSASTFWAVYPSNAVDAFLGESIVISIPSQQVAQEGTFANHFFPSIAKSTDTNLQFYNVCGGIKFSVVRDDIRSVSFEGKNNEVLAGKVKLAIGKNGYPEVVGILEGATAITLVAPNNGFFKPGEFYYLSVLPTSLDKGFSFRYKTSSQEDELEKGDTKVIKRSIFGVLRDIDSNNDNPDAIDLGLSVKWAKYNLGSRNIEQRGDYYAWGETEPNKTPYSLSSYKWWTEGYEYAFTKYNVVDNKTVLDLEDDAAHALLGDGWRMPTREEFEELIEGCTWEVKNIFLDHPDPWVTCYKGKSKQNGHVISLPICGYFLDSEIKKRRQTGLYWSSELSAGTEYNAESLYMTTEYTPRRGGDDRSIGCNIRPVYVDPRVVSKVVLSQTSLSLYVGHMANLSAHVVTSGSTNKTVTWTSSNTSVATVSNGLVTANAEGEVAIIASAGGKSATCLVKVTLPGSGPEAVDLGLSVKWASCNVGATKPEEFGDYFAWGETSPKSVYDWSNYKWCNGSSKSLTKYNTRWDLGTIDNKTQLEMSDDAARTNCGEKWRMPTEAECNELILNCSFTWTTLNDVRGCQVTSKINGNSIFFPAAAYWNGTRTSSVGLVCEYWSSSLYTTNTIKSIHLHIIDSHFDLGNNYRYQGRPIRPVTE